MTLNEKLKICEKCHKSLYNNNDGLICSLSKAKPAFETHCPDFIFNSEYTVRVLPGERSDYKPDTLSSSSKRIFGVLSLIISIIMWLIQEL